MLSHVLVWTGALLSKWIEAEFATSAPGVSEPSGRTKKVTLPSPAGGLAFTGRKPSVEFSGSGASVLAESVVKVQINWWPGGGSRLAETPTLRSGRCGTSRIHSPGAAGA